MEIASTAYPSGPGRMLRPDPEGPIILFPLRAGGPLRFRELTEEEIWLWNRQCEVVIAGHAWTEEIAVQYRAHYRYVQSQSSIQSQSSQALTSADTLHQQTTLQEARMPND